MDMPGQTSDFELAGLLREARQKTDELFSMLTVESLYRRAIAERHRIIFYVGHLEAFDWNLLAQRTCGRDSLHPRFEQLFAFGIDPIITPVITPADGSTAAGAGLPSDGPADWPQLAEVLAYRAAARAAIDECVEELLSAPRSTGLAVDSGRPPIHLAPIHMAIEHRLMHLETLAYMLPHLPLTSFVAERLAGQEQPLPQSPGYARTGGPGQVRMVAIPASSATLGRPRGGEFGWDNEYQEHVVQVPPFDIDARNVTNGEFAEFVVAGGYEDASLWREHDLRWKTASGLLHPLSWRRAGDQFSLRTAFAEVPLPLHWPAMVSLAEARAYARFASRQRGRTLRLPTEAEFHRAAYGVPSERGEPERPAPWGAAPALPLHHGNFGAVSYQPAPVAAFPAGDSAFGVADLIGNGWEWTSTPFRPFPGFQIDPLYPGYSQPFFDDHHYVLKGASFRTHQIFVRRSFRNWFQPHYPYVLATFRCAGNAGG